MAEEGPEANRKAEGGNLAGGTAETQRFYDEVGWVEEGGVLKDRALFGVREDGPIRIAAYRLRIERIRRALREAGDRLNLLECGCGGNPEMQLIDLCSHFTAVDFSSTGLDVAEEKLRESGVPFLVRQADMTDLPFKDEAFDAVYSAQAIYHIMEPEGQEAAFGELLRVLRPGGVAVFILANPRPLLFPLRMLKRLVADAPLAGSLVRRLRPKPPLPYNPRPLGWMRRRLQNFGEVRITAYAMASTAFNQRVTERRGVGRLAWRTIQRLERDHPTLAARLGNYVQITVHKTAHP